MLISLEILIPFKARKIGLVTLMKYQNLKKKFQKIVQKTKNKISARCKSHWDSQNQVRLENYPQCATQCATQWDSQNHMKSANRVRILQDWIVLILTKKCWRIGKSCTNDERPANPLRITTWRAQRVRSDEKGIRKSAMHHEWGAKRPHEW